MITLCERLIQDMQLQGFSPRTQQAYARAVRKLADHYHKAPDLVTEEELRQYFLYRTNVSRWSRVACTIALCGIKFFYERTLKRDWTTVGLAKPKRVKTLPSVLSVAEVRRALACVHMFRHRVCLATIYSCGLRLGEGRTLQIPDIDSARMFLHVRGKGNKDRYVPLPPRTLELLRELWKTHRHGQWLFPAPGRSGRGEATAATPLPVASVQIAFQEALAKARVHKRASVRTLRHSYATHLLEQGVDLRIIQHILGHATPQTTMLYTQLTEPALKPATAIIHRLMADL
jgi:site-specific recombinase XerD